MSNTTNGTTAWIRDPATGTPTRILCLLRADVGAANREKDEDVCLEELDGFGSEPGTTTNNDDTTMDSRWDETADKDMVIEQFNNGKTPVVGEPYVERFKTEIVIALISGKVIALKCWISKFQLMTLERNSKTKLQLTLPTNTLWTKGIGDFNTVGSVDPDFSDFIAPIAAYYTALTANVSILEATKRAKAIALQAKPMRVEPKQDPVETEPVETALDRWLGKEAEPESEAVEVVASSMDRWGI